jgi:hypothetical protein
MRIVTGRGKNRDAFEFATGSKIGLTDEHVAGVCKLFENCGVVFYENAGIRGSKLVPSGKVISFRDVESKAERKPKRTRKPSVGHNSVQIPHDGVLQEAA